MAAPKLALTLVCLSAAGILMAAASYQAEIASWRQQRESGLRRDGGWLTVTGLFWLREGTNRFGTNSANEIVLPNGPSQAGIFELHKGKVTANVNGSSREIRPDTDDLVPVGRLRLYVIQRGDRFAIASYLGSSDVFDRAITDFASAYADQNERDFETAAPQLASDAPSS